MIKYHIIKGSFKKMESIVSDLKYIDFSTIIYENDSALRSGRLRPYKDENILVIRSEDYYLITPEANHRLFSLINEICDSNANVYIQNPHKELENRITNTGNFKMYKEEFALNSSEEVRSSLEHIQQNDILNQIYRKINFSLKIQKRAPTVFLLYGESGLGKTFLVKEFSKAFYRDDNSIIRVQLSNYQNMDNLSDLFGEQINSNDLANKIQNRESNIILLDEFDKVHSIAYNTFYVMFDEGVLETRFRKVDISNLIIFCTSNYTSIEEIEKNLPQPIFNRIDKFVKFNHYSEKQIHTIIDTEINKINEILLDEVSIADVKERVINKLQINISKINYRKILNAVESSFEEILSE